MKTPKFRIGDVVEVSALVQRMDEKLGDLSYHRIFTPVGCKSFKAIITGAGFRNEGVLKYTGESYELKTSKRVPVWYVRRYVRGKEIAVPEEGIIHIYPYSYYGNLIPDIEGKNIRIQPVPFNNKGPTWEQMYGKEQADKMKAQSRNDIKLQPRDSNGRLSKIKHTVDL